MIPRSQSPTGNAYFEALHKLPEVKYNHDKLTVLNVLADWEITPADIFSWLMVK
ncbi:MAG: hypothetical protein HWQ23_06555 [Nostoc sp. JL33]|uniref:hypothetical protein n=1 Tax=Nostoc sp. JL33 TaxID=2815396 RepID=UPI0025F1C496|nr:hypothetical protein [Nostoc sp. JL33]MBN3869965.1 hypothetical protein [Nostoc sp. JL33]